VKRHEGKTIRDPVLREARTDAGYFRELVSATDYRTNWGVSFRRLRTDSVPEGYTRPGLRNDPSMFVLRVRCVSTPEILGGRFGV